MNKLPWNSNLNKGKNQSPSTADVSESKGACCLPQN